MYGIVVRADPLGNALVVPLADITQQIECLTDDHAKISSSTILQHSLAVRSALSESSVRISVPGERISETHEAAGIPDLRSEPTDPCAVMTGPEFASLLPGTELDDTLPTFS